MTFSRMMQGCRPRDPSAKRAPCSRRNACKPADWQRVFAFAGRAQRGGERPAGDSLPAFLGGLAEALGWSPPPQKRPVRREMEPQPFRREVERKLEPLLATGDVGIDRIARALGCSRQTLYRRLKAEGTTFEQLLDSLRHRLALRYIDGEGRGVKQTAYLLGFSEPASFSRAFKRWTGRNPGARS